MNKTSVRMLLLPVLAPVLMFSCTYLKPKRLMSWDDYVRQPRNNPYVLELESQGGSLVYYGAFHKVDPAHPQFADIEHKWTEFRPTLAYCEGMIWPLEASRVKAIVNYGEQGLVTFLAARDRIPIECIDPTLKEQMIYLKKHFSPQLIKVYYVLRQAAVNRMLKKDSRDLRFADYLFKSFDRIKGFHAFPNSVEELERMLGVVFPHLVPWQDIPYFYFHSPESGDFLTRIHRKLNEYRDQVMLKKVIRALKEGNRIFAIVGRSHVVIQEAVLKSLS